MFKKTVILGAFISWTLINSALAQTPNSQSPSMGFIGTVGGYRHIFGQGSTFGIDVSVNDVLGYDFKRRLNNQRNALFDTSLKRELNVLPSFSIGRVINDQFHVTLGLGVGMTPSNQRADNSLGKVPAAASQTTLNFVPSVGAEYAYTKHLSFIGNVSYETNRKGNTHLAQNAAPAVPGSSYWSAIKPKFLRPKAGIVYRF